MTPAGVVSRAAEHLDKGGVIAFPTETVFGLGADAHNDEAIEKIYALKGRDAAKVMSLHVSDAAMARRYAQAWPGVAERWTARFWPGPLTIVLDAAEGPGLSGRAIGADGTVGLRCPDHGVTRAVIERLGRAIVGTSANKSGESACVTAGEVRALFGDPCEVLVIDADCAASGVASTVVSLVDAERPRILRTGGLSAEMLGIR